LVKIAAELERALAEREASGAPGRTTPRVLAQGHGWTVSDVICTSGPRDSPFEEQHSHISIAIVAAGTFQYRTESGRELMTPGSFLLGKSGDCFECSHEHGKGDRCVAFHYAPDYFEGIAADAGAFTPAFRIPRLPPMRELAPIVARACAGLTEAQNGAWEELEILLAARVIQLAEGTAPNTTGSTPGAMARITETVRRIERQPSRPLSLNDMAREARLSPYHFLRTFTRVTGLTPHQYVLRARLREAALRLADHDRIPLEKILDVALECGFDDVSNFNHAFRAEFGVSPRVYRAQMFRPA
jgi:AraC-like DNA-binding protein